jgi:hypothetical protein
MTLYQKTTVARLVYTIVALTYLIATRPSLFHSIGMHMMLLLLWMLLSPPRLLHVLLPHHHVMVLLHHSSSSSSSGDEP